MVAEVVAEVIVLLLLMAVIGWLVVAFWAPGREAERERERIDAEVRLAEWRMRQVANQAFKRMLDEARRQP